MFWYVKNAVLPPCRTLIYLASRQPDLLIAAAISRRHAVRGDYDCTSLRHLRSHFCTMHALGRAVRAARCVSIGTLYESCPLSELWERVFISLVRCARSRDRGIVIILTLGVILSRDALNCCRFVLPTMCSLTFVLHWHFTRTVSTLSWPAGTHCRNMLRTLGIVHILTASRKCALVFK